MWVAGVLGSLLVASQLIVSAQGLSVFINNTTQIRVKVVNSTTGQLTTFDCSQVNPTATPVQPSQTPIPTTNNPSPTTGNNNPTPTTGNNPTPTTGGGNVQIPPPEDGLWISGSRLMSLPTSGAAWNNLMSEASKSAGTPDLSNQDDPTNMIVMAKALVCARVNQHCQDVVAALQSVVNNKSEDKAKRTLATGRELAAYVISADLINLKVRDPGLDAQFRTRIWEIITKPMSDNHGGKSVYNEHEVTPNNWGTMAGGSRVAVVAYLGNKSEIDKAANTFLGWLGDTSKSSSFDFKGDTSWQCSRPYVGVNPANCSIQGHDVGGALPEEMRRSCSFTWPPCKSGYNWEAWQGAIVQAVILYNQGYDVWNASDKAILRGYQWLHSSAMNFPASGDDTWQPYLVNYYYGSSFPAPATSTPGKNAGWADWTHP